VRGYIVALVLVAAAAAPLSPERASGQVGSAGATRCLPVPPIVVQTIQRGLKGRTFLTFLRAPRAARSRSGKRLYYVSADIHGPGARGKTEIATWAMRRLAAGAVIVSANRYARLFSKWPGATGSTPGDEASRASQRCVAEALA